MQFLLESVYNGLQQVASAFGTTATLFGFESLGLTTTFSLQFDSNGEITRGKKLTKIKMKSPSDATTLLRALHDVGSCPYFTMQDEQPVPLYLNKVSKLITVIKIYINNNLVPHSKVYI